MRGMPSFIPSCWEVMGCGREPGGRNVLALGLCAFGKVKGGTCWLVAGDGRATGQDQCSYVKAGNRCVDCRYYHLLNSQMEEDMLEGSGSVPAEPAWVDVLDEPSVPGDPLTQL
jgi:hypothetical protein